MTCRNCTHLAKADVMFVVCVCLFCCVGEYRGNICSGLCRKEPAFGRYDVQAALCRTHTLSRRIPLSQTQYMYTADATHHFLLASRALSLSKESRHVAWILLAAYSVGRGALNPSINIIFASVRVAATKRPAGEGAHISVHSQASTNRGAPAPRVVGIGAILSISSKTPRGAAGEVYFTAFAPGSPSGLSLLVPLCCVLPMLHVRTCMLHTCVHALSSHLTTVSLTHIHTDEAAQRGDLKVGDVLAEIEGNSITTATFYDVASLLLGPPGEECRG